MNAVKKLRDWVRGYSDEDKKSLNKKLASDKELGEITWLSLREWKAFNVNR